MSALIVVDFSETQGGSSVNDTAEVIALGDSRYMRGSGRKTGGRETGGREAETIRGSGKNLGRREEDTGNMADISSELHTGTFSPMSEKLSLSPLYNRLQVRCDGDISEQNFT